MYFKNVFVMVLTLCTLKKSTGSRVVEVRGIHTVLAEEGEEVKISCTHHATESCIFVHPNGTKFVFAGIVSNPHCSITLKVRKGDSGQWNCSVGSDTVRAENVRVVDKMAAAETNITIPLGREATLLCVTAVVPVLHCWFLSPNGMSFFSHINGSRGPQPSGKCNSCTWGHKFEKPCLRSSAGDYLTSGVRDLERGNCRLTVRRAAPRDRGSWRCEAQLWDVPGKHKDDIRLRVTDSSNPSLALVAGISFTSTLLLAAIAFAAAVLWRRRRASRPRARARVRSARAHSESEATARAHVNVPLIIVQMTRSSSAGLIDEICLK